MTEQTPMLLEKAKDLVSGLRMEYESNHPMFQEGDINILEWLINQAETARRVKEENTRLKDQLELKESEYQATITKVNTCSKLYRELQQESEQLKEALEIVLVGAKQESCKHDDQDPTWHCCDWAGVATGIESILKEVTTNAQRQTHNNSAGDERDTQSV